MAEKLTYSKTNMPHRTARTIARANGAAVPPLPAVKDYCPSHGTTHAVGGCNTMAPDAEATEISASGGSAKLPVNIKPFKLGG